MIEKAGALVPFDGPPLFTRLAIGLRNRELSAIREEKKSAMLRLSKLKKTERERIGKLQYRLDELLIAWDRKQRETGLKKELRFDHPEHDTGDWNSKTVADSVDTESVIKTLFRLIASSLHVNGVFIHPDLMIKANHCYSQNDLLGLYGIYTKICKHCDGSDLKTDAARALSTELEICLLDRLIDSERAVLREIVNNDLYVADEQGRSEFFTFLSKKEDDLRQRILQMEAMIRNLTLKMGENDEHDC
jgi:hypothetical protein